MSQAVDYSWARPDPAWIASSGFVGALRYLAPLPNGKVIQKAELDALHAAGLAVGFVWETTGNRAGEGSQAGGADAMAANRMADTLGVPNDLPIYYAVDFQATWPQVEAYFAGADAAGGRPVRPYGCYDIAEGSQRPTWQCAAWSGNGTGSGGSIDGRRVSEHAVLYQRVGYVLGNTADANDVLSPDWAGWLPGQAPAPQPVPLPTDDGEDAVSLLVLDPDNVPWVWEISGLHRRHVNDPDELHLLQFVGAKYLDENTDAEMRRLWLKARIPVAT